jgi:hypothetical protein
VDEYREDEFCKLMMDFHAWKGILVIENFVFSILKYVAQFQ